MSKLITSKMHITTVRRVFSWNELRLLLADTVAKEAKMPPPHIPRVRNSDQSITVTVKFEDETEGSPAYRVGYRAVVTIEHDHEYVGEQPSAEA